MELFTTILLTFIILLLSFRKPMAGLALLLQINIVRALVGLDVFDPCFYCREPDAVLGAIIPVLAFLVILIKLRLSGRIKYVLDYYDVFFVFVIAMLLITTTYAKDFTGAIAYTFKFIFLGSSYYFLAKIVLININNPQKALKDFFIYSLKLSVFFGLLGAYFYIFKGDNVYRLSFPSVHPIPFSQLIGLGAFTSFLIFITNGTIFNLKSKGLLKFNKILLPTLLLILFGTNTRGVMLSLALAVLFYMTLAKIKIPKRILYVSGGLMFLGLIMAINYIDFEVLFRRILWDETDKSVDDRLIAYTDSFSLFFNYPQGIGANGFKEFSILPYPHNLFLETIAQYGIFGLLVMVYFLVLLVYMLILTLKHSKKSFNFPLIFSLLFYFIIETMFSFTLWMHKGMYFFIGVFAAYHYLLRKQQINEL